MNPYYSIKNKPRIGDIVLFSPDNTPSYEAQILELNNLKNNCKLIIDKDEPLVERIFEIPHDSLRLKFPRREYKVINLTEYPDSRTGQKLLLAELSHVQKTFSITENNVICSLSFSTNDIELYVLPLISILAQHLINHPEETIMICHVMYFIERDFILDGNKIKASFISQPDFLSPKEQAFVKRNKHLFAMEDQS